MVLGSFEPGCPVGPGSKQQGLPGTLRYGLRGSEPNITGEGIWRLAEKNEAPMAVSP